MDSEPFGRMRDGREVSRHRIRNARGTEAVFVDLGASLTEFHFDGVDVVLGHDDLASCEAAIESSWMGCVVGRVANRIAGASFEIGGERFDLEANEGANHLHGGSQGLSTRVWSARPLVADGGPGVVFECVSADGDAGYPGRLEVEVAYQLTEDDRLRIVYTAEVDRPTPVNPTQHAYFNLAGEGDVLGHELEIAASRHVEVGAGLIPTGALLDVADTPFDFRAPKPLGRDFDHLDDAGYDLSFMLDGYAPDRESDVAPEPHPGARLTHPASGRVMTVRTSEPCLQLYSGQHLDGAMGKAGRRHTPFAGLCLEAQHPPDALHQPGFPSVMCRPGETRWQMTEYAFSCV